MTFAHPLFLVFLWLVPFAAFLWLWMRKRNLVRIAGISSSASAAAAKSDTRFRIQLAFALAGSAFAVIAAAQPRWGEREEVVFSKGRNVVIAVDVSRSMLAEDVRPSRLERVRVDLRDLLSDLEGDRAGLLAFRGGSVLLCPLTTDVGFLRQTLDGLSVNSAPRGETDLGDAIRSSLKALEPFPADHNAIILISDGEDLRGEAAAEAKKAGEAGIPVFTVGIGDSSGTGIPTGTGAALEYKGEKVVTKLDNQTLLDISAASGGKYLPLQTAGIGGNVTLGSLYRRHMRNVEAKEFSERSEKRAIERYQWFLIPAVLLFAAVAVLSRGRPSRRRIPRAAAAAAAVFALIPGFSMPAESPSDADRTAIPEVKSEAASADDVSPEERSGIMDAASALDTARAAQKAYAAGDYAAAARGFAAAGTGEGLDSGTSAAFKYNEALSLFRAGSVSNAVSAFRAAVAADPKSGDAAEGLGAALYEAAAALENGTSADGHPMPPDEKELKEKIALLEESASAFQDALRADPSSGVRRGNLALSLEMLPEMRSALKAGEIAKKYEGKQPGELLAELIKRQRENYRNSVLASKDNTPDQIIKLENVAKAQREAAEIWTPLSSMLVEQLKQSMTNEQEFAKAAGAVEDTRKRMIESAAEMENLETDGAAGIAENEKNALMYFLMLADPPALIDESAVAQTNTMLTADFAERPRAPVQDQALSQLCLKRFQEIFPAWIDRMNQTGAAHPGTPDTVKVPVPQTAAETNGALSASAPAEELPVIKEEDRQLIERLTEETLIIHQEILDGAGKNGGKIPASMKPRQEEAMKNILKIRDLLPKNQNQQQNQQNQEEQQQQQQDQNSQDNQDQQEPEEQQEDQKEEEAETAEKSEEEKNDEELKAMMQQVLDREKEYKEDKQKRENIRDPLLHERDW